MEISTNPTSPIMANSVTARTSDGKISSDFETFLVMLTAQMENQDPLNPVDSSDYAVQLATFSSVEQQVMTNDLLKEMIGASGSDNLAQMSDWVGMDARLSGLAEFAGGPVELYFDVPTAATKSEIVLTDKDGNDVRKIDVTGRKSPLTWDGLTNTGALADTGAYTAMLVRYGADGNVTGAINVDSYATVSEVRNSGGATEIMTQTGAVISTESIVALRG
ncbi:flagellar hook capping FlgD N-terminal domain-containing protein [Qingshengfaniella alkalisoli]|uniref:Basal-body rod modification protein FlgD n=1 Tax=Qingshengfaniella alkalisoli TaxID=2599296 RepID=A0A5B8IAB3_9RHOB|nr:flagellar hook capping FlgD N-terminal domain-containing protein [Qingshengfaniella alkalisoli]QDY70166.1 flagellar basal body rod modification protein [Qingshengfaniella alkalisoli]